MLLLLAALALYAFLLVRLSGAMIAPPRPRVSDTGRAALGVVLDPTSREPRILRVVSPAREAGLRPGDRIVSVGGSAVAGRAGLEARVAEAGGGPLRIEVRRADGAALVDVVPEIRMASPADLGLAYEDVSFRNPDGLTIRGWYLPPPGADGRAPAVVHGHGNAADRRHHLDLAVALHEEGLAQLLIDFAGRGESDGEVITLGAHEAGDLSAALDWLAARPDVDGGRMALAGTSMGAVAAVLAAAGRDDVRALALDGCYADLPRLVRESVAARHIPPVLIAPALLALAGWRAGYDPAAVAPVEALAGTTCPVLIVHGLSDTIVPFAHARDLATAAGARATLVPLPGLGHNDLRPPEAVQRTARFLAAATRPAGR